MKKIILILAVVVLAVVSGWVYFMPRDNSQDKTSTNADLKQEQKGNFALAKENEDYDYRIFKSEKGDIKIPKNPQRIAVLSASPTGTIIKFGGKIIAHEKWAQANPSFKDYLSNSTLVPEDGIEEVMVLKPDLIIVASTNKKYADFSKIAPTVSFSYGKMTYLESIITYADLIGKKSEAEAWVADFQKQAKQAGEQIKQKYGENVSISVMEAYGDDIYLFGDNWGRGTQIVYKEMGLKMPDEVKKIAKKTGYSSISVETIPKYSADLMIFCYYKGANTSFLESQTWQNLKSVKTGNLLKVEAEGFYATDTMALENQLRIIKAFFLKNLDAQIKKSKNDNGALVEEDANSEFRPYPSVGGDVLIPKDPKRIVVALHMFAGEFAQYAADKVVGYAVHPSFKNKPQFLDKLKNAEALDPNDLEKIMALKPDLIYSSTYAKNNAELAKIAPTVIDEVMNNKRDYFTKNIEIAGVVNKTEEAKKWVADFTKRSKQTAEKLRKKYGENISASVFMTIGDNLYYVAPFGMRGSYLLNKVMELPMPNIPENIQANLKTNGASAISVETLPEVAGDLILVCSYAGSNNSFTQTETWKNLPAVKKGNYLITECEKFGYVDGASMEFKLKTIEEHFLNKKDTSAIQVSSKDDFKIVKSFNGEVKIPRDPQRIAVLSTIFVGEFAQFAADKIIAYELNKSFKYDPVFKDLIKDAKAVDTDNLEEIMALKPDLIFTATYVKNYKDFAKIAPTIVLDINPQQTDYLTNIVSIADIVNKKVEAEAWVEDFKKRAGKVAEKLRKKYGQNITSSVIMTMGDNLALIAPMTRRGAYLLTKVMNIPMPKLPKEVQEVISKRGSTPISSEALSKVVGDLIVLCENANSNTTFLQTDTWKNIPAVKKGNVLMADCQKFGFADGLSLEYKLNEIEKFFLNKK